MEGNLDYEELLRLFLGLFSVILQNPELSGRQVCSSSSSQDVVDRFLQWSPIQLWSPSPPLICLNSSNIPLCQPHPPQHFVNANEAICKVYVNRLFGKNLMKREIQILRWVYCREIWCQTYFPSQQMFLKMATMVITIYKCFMWWHLVRSALHE